MKFNYNKLRGRIVEIFGSQGEFAKKMGWSERTLSLHMTGNIVWKQPEMVKALTLLDVDLSLVSDYFFTLDVQNV